MATELPSRLKVIDLYLTYFGEIRRPQLMRHCGISEATASKALKAFADQFPEDIGLDHRYKSHRAPIDYEPKCAHTAEEGLELFTYGRVWDTPVGAQFGHNPEGMDFTVRRLNPNTTGLVLRALSRGLVVEIAYQSTSDTADNIWRKVVPLATFRSAGHWYFRAHDLNHGEPRTFRFTRVEQAKPTLQKAHADQLRDPDWVSIVELRLIPHPRAHNHQAIALDLGISQQQPRIIHTNAVEADFVLQALRVDCSNEHVLDPRAYPMALDNAEALKAQCNLLLAPGAAQ